MFKKLLLLLAFVSYLFGCSPTNYTNGVPNLVQVHSELWRSGQPTTDVQWQYLYSLGIRHVVKLNFNSEGSDDGATKAGLDVHVLSIQPEGDKDIWSNITNTFVELISQAEAIIASGGGVLVHCTHGQDRTGLVISISRLLYDGWTKEQAWNEMLDRGFHPELLGLVSFWLDYDPSNYGDAGL
jgi:tyrosine-protein phosphatase SIW14